MSSSKWASLVSLILTSFMHFHIGGKTEQVTYVRVGQGANVKHIVPVVDVKLDGQQQKHVVQGKQRQNVQVQPQTGPKHSADKYIVPQHLQQQQQQEYSNHRNPRQQQSIQQPQQQQQQQQQQRPLVQKQQQPIQQQQLLQQPQPEQNQPLHQQPLQQQQQQSLQHKEQQSLQLNHNQQSLQQQPQPEQSLQKQQQQQPLQQQQNPQLPLQQQQQQPQQPLQQQQKQIHTQQSLQHQQQQPQQPLQQQQQPQQLLQQQQHQIQPTQHSLQQQQQQPQQPLQQQQQLQQPSSQQQQQIQHTQQFLQQPVNQQQQWHLLQIQQQLQQQEQQRKQQQQNTGPQVTLKVNVVDHQHHGQGNTGPRAPVQRNTEPPFQSQERPPPPSPMRSELLPAIETKGEPWPMPKMYIKGTGVYSIYAENFGIYITGKTCKIIEEARERYTSIILDSVIDVTTKNPGNESIFHRRSEVVLKRLNVTLLAKCEEYPSLGMDESYELTVNSRGALLISKSVWGILRGLETFSQLVLEVSPNSLQIGEVRVKDSPRFSHRGILLDTARHYIPKEIIFQVLESMAYNKMNVFHWHIVDDQSFPYYSTAFPNLSRKGAYDPDTHIYTPKDVQEIIEYARLRGIRVIPEFDTPGHTLSWGWGQEGLLTKCYSPWGHLTGHGPIHPFRNSTYQFLGELFKEITAVFPDKHLHLGGDEVDTQCWISNPFFQNFMALKRLSDWFVLQELYLKKFLRTLAEVVPEKNKKEYIVWQEVFDNRNKVPNTTIIEVWKSPEDYLVQVTSEGHRAIFASCWYLDHISYGEDWKTYYACDPLNPRFFYGTEEQANRVIGGEACLWSEYVDETNVLARLWPRASATAERLWSPQETTLDYQTESRLMEHRCRMVRRGIPAQPFHKWGGYCKSFANSLKYHWKNGKRKRVASPVVALLDYCGKTWNGYGAAYQGVFLGLNVLMTLILMRMMLKFRSRPRLRSN